MALSNYLTRDEWNAVYFVGLREATTESAAHRGIRVTDEGNITKVEQCCAGNVMSKEEPS